jgi:hypothetical protein
MEWKRQPKDGQIAREISAYAGAPNTHQVRSLVTTLDTYAVVTWMNYKRLWEVWKRTDSDCTDDYWVRINHDTSAAGAKAYVTMVESERLVLEEVRQMPEGTGLTVIAEWLEPYHGSTPMRLACSSSTTAEVIASIFKRMGCSVTTEVAA